MILALLLAAAAAAPSDAAEAVRLYDAGRYADARVRLEAIEKVRALSGPLLYRLYFCRRVTGDEVASKDALERALVALEREAPEAKDLETPFYLANTYVNLQRADDARRVAERTTASVESGTLQRPSTPMEEFQLAKLYQDRQRLDEAAAGYRRALAGFEAAPSDYPGNVRWARTFLAQLSLSRGDLETAERQLSALASGDGAQAADFRRLGEVRVRLADYRGAAEAWKEADRADPGNGDDPRYAARLALMAASVGKLPEAAPDGTAFDRMRNEALEQLMRDQADRARKARERAEKALADGSATPKLRAEVEAELSGAKAMLAAAGLEYAVRGLPIRETAFHDGYAVLLFQEQPWTWPGAD